MPLTRHIAVDLGAESGRVMLGTLDGGRLTLEEVHRFPNAPVRGGDGLFWDTAKLHASIDDGFRELPRFLQSGPPPASVSVNSWGVDYVPIGTDAEGRPVVRTPHHYRDPRTDAIFDALTDADRRVIFEQTGVQFLHFNTLYQLIADVRQTPGRLAGVDTVLTMADYFNYSLSGRRAVEASMASTTQLFNPRTRQWSQVLIERFGLPAHVFPRLVEGGTVLGAYAPEDYASFFGTDALQVIATNSHDTGCAVAATPGEGEDWAYLSSGTWSLLGVELPSPVITDRCRELNFTNEQGYAGTTRLLKNLSGLFILQECRGEWAARGEEHDYATLAAMAEKAQPLKCLIRPDAPEFGKPGGMLGKIDAYCRRTDQQPPASPGEVARCIYESLALLYHKALADVEELSGRSIRRVHVVGGGSRSRLLNRLTADAIGRTVVAGPTEATAAGNVLIQAAALGHVAGLTEIRRIVRDSFDLQTYQPRPGPLADAFDRFTRLPL